MGLKVCTCYPGPGCCSEEGWGEYPTSQSQGWDPGFTFLLLILTYSRAQRQDGWASWRRCRCPPALRGDFSGPQERLPIVQVKDDVFPAMRTLVFDIEVFWSETIVHYVNSASLLSVALTCSGRLEVSFCWDPGEFWISWSSCGHSIGSCWSWREH